MNAALGIVTAVSAIFCILARNQGAKARLYFFKPLTMAAILAVVLVPAVGELTPYRGWVIAALTLSLVGDIFLMLPENRFVFGLAAFLFAHLCYISAFSTDFNLPRATWWLLGIIILSGATVAAAVLPSVGRLKVPVIIYILALATMVWLAWERSLLDPRLTSFAAAIGATFFMFSDSMLAINKFKSAFRGAQTFILSSYFAAQWLLAFSAA